ncbi:MAG: enoyl-CoA hydratase/isomerase family protein [Burkholderiaceae bacterium]|nr:enoyl-CoA hydratase/isomerase family protein [Burkholderiaceae bacterium]
MAGRVEFVSDGAVATVTLDSPGKLNAVSVAMWQALARIFNEIGDAESLRVIVVRGANGNFAAGADIEEFDRVRHDPSSGRQYHLETIGNALTAIDRCPVPLVAAIEGVCVGGGLEIASLCDIRLAAASARFGVPIGRLGFPLALPELVPLLRLAGPAVAAELLLESRVLSADEAAARGLITRVVAGASLEAELQLCVAHIAAGSPLAARQNKANIRRFQSRGLDYTQHELDESFAFLDSHDYHEGVRAFLAKRSPNFLGK